MTLYHPVSAIQKQRQSETSPIEKAVMIGGVTMVLFFALLGAYTKCFRTPGYDLLKKNEKIAQMYEEEMIFLGDPNPR
jgi:hypothetical protein